MNYFNPQSTGAQTHQGPGQDGHPTTLGERRNIDVGFKRYYEEDELDVGLGLVNDEEGGRTMEKKNGMTQVNIMYCSG